MNTIKIDREFIDNINESKPDTLIIETILDLAGNLGLSICVEGVETSEQSIRTYFLFYRQFIRINLRTMAT